MIAGTALRQISVIIFVNRVPDPFAHVVAAEVCSIARGHVSVSLFVLSRV